MIDHTDGSVAVSAQDCPSAAYPALVPWHARRAERRREAAGRQRARGRRSAWERLDLLLDRRSFTELGSLVRHRAQAQDLAARHPPDRDPPRKIA